MVRPTCNSSLVLLTVKYRASKAAEPSKTPISVTQSLSALRLTYARLLEEHGANVALLRRREAELAELDAQLQGEQAKVDELQRSLEAVTDKARRLEARADLAERDVGFLKAMLVRGTAKKQKYIY